MLIVINGSFGVGKSTICKNLIKELGKKEWIYLESDYYYIKMVEEDMNKALGTGTTPSTNEKFLRYYQELIIEEMNNKNVIVDLTINNYKAKDYIIDYLTKNDFKIIQIILESSQDKVLERTKNDNRECIELLYTYDENKKAFDELFPDIKRIDTTSIGIEEVTNLVLDHLKKKSKKLLS